MFSHQNPQPDPADLAWTPGPTTPEVHHAAAAPPPSDLGPPGQPAVGGEQIVPTDGPAPSASGGLQPEADFELAPPVRLTGTAEARFHQLVHHLRGTYALNPQCATAPCPACVPGELTISFSPAWVMLYCLGGHGCDEEAIALGGRFEVSDLVVEPS